MTCNQTSQLDRYHDGELAPVEREAIEGHLRACDQCRQRLAELKSLSSLIRTARLAEMPARLAIRFDRCRQTARDEGILRLAGWMTAAAAAVLIGALLIGHADQGATASQPAIWQTVAVTPSADLPDSENSDLAVAEWMVDELSAGEHW